MKFSCNESVLNRAENISNAFIKKVLLEQKSPGNPPFSDASPSDEGRGNQQKSEGISNIRRGILSPSGS